MSESGGDIISVHGGDFVGIRNLRDEDSFSEWITECCTTGAKASAYSSALFKSWSKWAERAGEIVGSNKALSKKLEKRGFVKGGTNAGALLRGIAVIPEPEAPYWEPA
jgi:putative DNA primase/helicase